MKLDAKGERPTIWTRILRPGRERRKMSRSEKVGFVGMVVVAAGMPLCGGPVLFEELSPRLAGSLADAVPFLLAVAAALAGGLAIAAAKRLLPAVPTAVAATLLVVAPFFVMVRAENSLEVQAARIDEALVSYDRVMDFSKADPLRDVAQQARDYSKAHMVDYMVRVVGHDPAKFRSAAKKDIP